MNIWIPATAPVGQYSLFIEADKVLATESPDPVTVLFNPWSKYDQVFFG
jgi:predicted phosphohydrolase